MRLGLWNRLALVLGALGAVGFPTWWALSNNLHHSQVMDSGYRTCLRAAFERQDAEGPDMCFDAWLAPQEGYTGWYDWSMAILWAIPAILAIYGLIWAAVSIVKWVWRGRNAQA